MYLDGVSIGRVWQGCPTVCDFDACYVPNHTYIVAILSFRIAYTCVNAFFLSLSISFPLHRMHIYNVRWLLFVSRSRSGFQILLKISIHCQLVATPS